MIPRMATRWASHLASNQAAATTTSTSTTPSSVLSAIRLATDAFKNSQQQHTQDTKKSFQNFVHLLKDQQDIPASLPSDLIKEINTALQSSLQSTSDIDRDYYLQQISSSSNPWIRLYALIYENELAIAIDNIKIMWDDQPLQPPQVIPIETLEVLLDKLLGTYNLAQFLSFYEWLRAENYPLEVPTKFLKTFVELCCKHTSEYTNDLLAKFFEKYILYTGPESTIKEEAFHIDDELLEEMIGSFQKMGNVKEYSKSVAYYMNRLKNESHQIKKFNSWRLKSRIAKFDMYLDKLGPYKVLENGMFFTFKIGYNKNIKIDEHLLPFVDALTKYLSKSETEITLGECLLLIEFMHGFHTQPYKEKFSKSLNPDIQMARIYRSVIRKTANPDPQIVQNYSAIIEMANDGKYKHMKDGLPKHRTLNQRFDKSEEEDADAKPFQSLPLEIMLRVLYNLTENKGPVEISNIIKVSTMLFQAMIMERKVRPSHGCFETLIKLLVKDPGTADQVSKIMAINHQLYRTSSPSLLQTLDALGLDKYGLPVTPGSDV